MQTNELLSRKRLTRTVPIWVALVLFSVLIFPPLPVFIIPDESAVAAYSADGSWIATVALKRSEDDTITLGEMYGPVHLWHLRGGGTRTRIIPSELRVRGLQFSNSGDLLIALWEDELCVWETRTGKQIVKQNSGELYSQWQSLVESDSGTPMVAMLRRTKPPSYSGASYQGQVDFIALPSGETHSTIGPVQIEADVHVWWGREKASLRISRNQNIGVTLQPAAGDKPATQFKQWDISSGQLLSTLEVSRPPTRWAISEDGAELIQLTNLGSSDPEQAKKSLNVGDRLQIEYWEFETGRLTKKLAADEYLSETQLIFGNCLGFRPASDSSQLLVSTIAGICLVDTSDDHLKVLANDLQSLISLDASLIAQKKGSVFSAPFIGRVNTRSIEIKRMPSGEVLRTIEAHSDWPADEVALHPLAFSQDKQNLIYVDYTENGPWALAMAHWGDLWNGSLLHGDSIRRNYCIRSMNISTGRTNVILRSARVTHFGAAVLGNRHVLVGDRVWRLSGGSPWLHILGLSTGVVTVVLTWKHLWRRHRQRHLKTSSGT